MPLPEVTVVIAARNAATTIERAVRSATEEAVTEILLVDDFSDDSTTALARAAGGARVRVIRPPRHHTLGLTRQSALESLHTPYAVNLDADDLLLPARVARLVSTMETTGADVATDSLELFDGKTDTLLRPLPLPSFLHAPGTAVRIFERNYLPGIGQVAYRTAFAQQVGYDPELHGVEDTDFFLRSVAAGGRVAFVPETGYRMYSYPSSVSRNLTRQRQMLAELLRKHDYAAVADRYRTAGYDTRVTAWGLCSMATFRNEFEYALAQLSAACPSRADLSAVLEPTGPYPVPEGWRLGFTRGTLLCHLNRAAEAIPCFDQASVFDGGVFGPASAGLQTRRSAPDLLNNWGVALAQTGQLAAGRAKIAAALELFPGYLDARLNLAEAAPTHLTSHPLRRQPSRSEY